MPVQPINLPFPAGGVVRRLANAASSAEGPMDTPWAMNVRLEDELSNRLRGGSFTAISLEAVPSDRTQVLLDDADEAVTDELGNEIFVSTESSMAASAGRLWADGGADAPDEHPADCIYRGRLVRPSGGIIYASRQGDYTDWDFSVDISDEQRAFAIQLSEAGEIGGDVVGLVPHKDAFMLAATSNSLWALSGDPASGGSLRNVSRGVGMVTARSWCKDHMDRVYFLSSHGLYTVGADGSGLQAISENALPEELTGVTDVGTVLAYNHADRGVYIHLPNSTQSFFYDTERQGFWPFRLDKTDSHLLLGPVKMGGIDMYGVLSAIHGMIATNSANVVWRIVTGETAEEAAANGKAAIQGALGGPAYSGSIDYMGTWSAGRSLTTYPRVRGMWACIWLQSSGTWAYERVTLQIATAGSWRS